MQLALVNGKLQEAQSRLKGKCRTCGGPVVGKDGPIRINHWAHVGRLDCDPSREGETKWHRAWKEQFPVHWREFPHKVKNNVWYRADVKTDEGWAIEFQHSHIKPEIRQARENFYTKLVWVVDGTKNERDGENFANAAKDGKEFDDCPIIPIPRWDECRLLRKWSGSDKHLFIDFGLDVLFWVFDRMPNQTVYYATLDRTAFIESHRDGDFEKFVKSLKVFKSYYEALEQADQQADQQARLQAHQQARQQPPQNPQQLPGDPQDPLGHFPRVNIFKDRRSSTPKVKPPFPRKSRRL